MIKFLDLQKINAQYVGEFKQAAAEVIDQGWFLLGKRVKTFEQQYSEFINVKNTVACANGLEVLCLILRVHRRGIMQEDDNDILGFLY
jgi:dTDP-4-amino-4,6-dideoxygalactose transaminase